MILIAPGVKLSGANLEEMLLFELDLSNADFTGTQLSAATFKIKINLSGANLQKADLVAAELKEANLTNADFAEANLCGADLAGAIIANTNFENAIYDDETIFPEGFEPKSAGMTWEEIDAF